LLSHTMQIASLRQQIPYQKLLDGQFFMGFHRIINDTAQDRRIIMDDNPLSR
jgi:hypothetical protein